MNVQHQLARVGAGLRDLGNDILDGEIGPGHAAMRIAELADLVSDIDAYLRPERRRLAGPRRWWFLLTRRPIV